MSATPAHVALPGSSRKPPGWRSASAPSTTSTAEYGSPAPDRPIGVATRTLPLQLGRLWEAGDGMLTDPTRTTSYRRSPGWLTRSTGAGRFVLGPRCDGNGRRAVAGREHL